MAGMKIAALIDAEIGKAKAETRADIVAALETVEDEIQPMQASIERLRSDVDRLMKAPKTE